MSEQDKKRDVAAAAQDGDLSGVPADVGGEDGACGASYSFGPAIPLESWRYDAHDRLCCMNSFPGEETTYEPWRDPDPGDERVSAKAGEKIEDSRPARASVEEERSAHRDRFARWIAFLGLLRVLRRAR